MANDVTMLYLVRGERAIFAFFFTYMMETWQFLWEMNNEGVNEIAPDFSSSTKITRSENETFSEVRFSSPLRFCMCHYFGVAVSSTSVRHVLQRIFFFLLFFSRSVSSGLVFGLSYVALRPKLLCFGNC